MEHLKYIRQVADEDITHLQEKEKTYKGSWKRRGGSGAFMMAARKWDRLEVMMQNPIGFRINDQLQAGQKFDIFQQMEIQGGSGADGTVLAEVRDLRRYLLLIEAEMMARGVVTANAVTEPSREDPIYYGSERLEKNIADILNEPFDKEGGDMSPWRVVAEENPEPAVYGRWAPGVWQMHETVGYNACPVPYRKWYYWLGDGWGLLNRDMVKTTLPKFQVHINHSEWSMLSSVFQGLYRRANDGVYHIKDVFREGWT